MFVGLCVIYEYIYEFVFCVCLFFRFLCFFCVIDIMYGMRILIIVSVEFLNGVVMLKGIN